MRGSKVKRLRKGWAAPDKVEYEKDTGRPWPTWREWKRGKRPDDVFLWRLKRNFFPKMQEFWSDYSSRIFEAIQSR